MRALHFGDLRSQGPFPFFKIDVRLFGESKFALPYCGEKEKPDRESGALVAEVRFLEVMKEAGEFSFLQSRMIDHGVGKKLAAEMLRRIFFPGDR